MANRRLLDEQLADYLLVDEQNSDGHLLMLQINDLVGLNQRLGGQRTDALISATGELLKRLTQLPERRAWLAARNRGGEFSLLMPGLNTEAPSDWPPRSAPLGKPASDRRQRLHARRPFGPCRLSPR